MAIAFECALDFSEQFVRTFSWRDEEKAILGHVRAETRALTLAFINQALQLGQRVIGILTVGDGAKECATTIEKDN